MNKKGDKYKVSYHNGVLQPLSWICESEVTHFHEFFCIMMKYFEEKIFLYQNTIQKLKKIKVTIQITRRLSSSGVQTAVKT